MFFTICFLFSGVAMLFFSVCFFTICFLFDMLHVCFSWSHILCLNAANWSTVCRNIQWISEQINMICVAGGRTTASMTSSTLEG
jgi:hypothetical protein